MGKYYLFLFPSKTHKKFPSQLDKIGWFPSQLIKFISQPGIKLINTSERNNNNDNNNNTYINVAKCNLGKANLETMLVCSFSCYTGGGPMPLAGPPRDLYTQLLACSSSQSVVAIACYLLVILFFFFWQTAVTLVLVYDTLNVLLSRAVWILGYFCEPEKWAQKS